MHAFANQNSNAWRDGKIHLTVVTSVSVRHWHRTNVRQIFLERFDSYRNFSKRISTLISADPKSKPDLTNLRYHRHSRIVNERVTCPLGTSRWKFSASLVYSLTVVPPCLRIAVATMFSALRFPNRSCPPSITSSSGYSFPRSIQPFGTDRVLVRMTRQPTC